MKRREIRKLLVNEKGHYFTGRRCNRDHLSWRKRGGQCIACTRLNEGRPIILIKKSSKSPEDIKLKNSKKYKEKRIKKPYLALLKNARRRAKKKNLFYNLTLEWAQERWTGRCEISGLPFDLTFSGKRADCYLPSLDRKDNSLGYTPENCRFILYSINALKGELSDEFVKYIAKSIIEKNLLL